MLEMQEVEINTEESIGPQDDEDMALVDGENEIMMLEDDGKYEDEDTLIEEVVEELVPEDGDETMDDLKNVKESESFISYHQCDVCKEMFSDPFSHSEHMRTHQEGLKVYYL